MSYATDLQALADELALLQKVPSEQSLTPTHVTQLIVLIQTLLIDLTPP